MLTIHDPPAVVEPAPQVDGSTEDLLQDLPPVEPEDRREDDAGADGSGDASLSGLVQEERRRLCDFLGAVAEFDRQGLWRDLGYPSLLAYLRSELGLSSVSAYQRKVAVELVQRYPEVLEALRDGRICLNRIADLARVISPANPGEAIARFSRSVSPRGDALALRLLHGNDWLDHLAGGQK